MCSVAYVETRVPHDRGVISLRLFGVRIGARHLTSLILSTAEVHYSFRNYSESDLAIACHSLESNNYTYMYISGRCSTYRTVIIISIALK